MPGLSTRHPLLRSVSLAALLTLHLPASAANYFETPVGQGFASLFVPGSGQWLQGNDQEAVIYAGSFAVGVVTLATLHEEDDRLRGDERFDDEREIQFYNRTTLRYDMASLFLADLAQYSAFAAYRDAREDDDREYRTPAPRETLLDLSLAPFRWRYLSRPTTFVPLLLTGVALAQTESGDPDDGLYEIRYADDVDPNELALFYSLGIAYGPAVAEEAFFRGFLNNQFSHAYGEGWGLATSSALFALGHLGEGNQADAFTAGVFGAYVGWLQQSNGYAIGEGVAIHFWSNFLAGVTALSHGGEARELLRIGFRY